MKPRILVAALPLLWAGCATEPGVAEHGPYVKPGLIMLTPDQARRVGVEVQPAGGPEAPLPKDSSPLDTRAVIAPADVKVYTVGRTVDAADPALLHEQHVLYRRETSPRWRLKAPAEQMILVGPRVTDGRQDLTPLLTKEVATFLAEQRRTNEANEKAIGSLFQALQALNRQQAALIRRQLDGANSGPATTAPAASESAAPAPAGPAD